METLKNTTAQNKWERERNAEYVPRLDSSLGSCCWDVLVLVWNVLLVWRRGTVLASRFVKLWVLRCGNNRWAQGKADKPHLLLEVLLYVLSCWKGAQVLKTYCCGKRDISSLAEVCETGLYRSAGQADVWKGDRFCSALRCLQPTVLHWFSVWWGVFLGLGLVPLALLTELKASSDCSLYCHLLVALKWKITSVDCAHL